MTVEKLSWKGFDYTPKPFTLGNYYTLLEGYVENVSLEIGGQRVDSLKIAGSFVSSCVALLQGATKSAQSFLISGELVKSILEATDEAEIKKGLEFKDAVDFLSGKFIDTANRLKQSAPDLTEKLAKVESGSRKSRKATKEEPVRSD